MSLSTATLAAPTPAAAPTPVATPGTPFERPPADTVGGWVAGVLFGLLCIVAALVFVTGIAVVALAGVIGRGLATLADGRPGLVRAGRPALA